MEILITLFYYAMTAFIAIVMIRNFIKNKNWQEEVLYIIVLIPFILRILHIK